MTDTQSHWVNDQTYKSRWERAENLASGAQGEAYRAVRLSDEKIGFLKVIKSKKDDERRARFFREASAYESFGVNGIPRLIESNAHLHTDGTVTPFIVTEFIAGPTLRAWRMSQATVTLETAVTITLALLDILQECHDQGCVHRDIKPDNIILESSDPARVWLLDFGISYHGEAGCTLQTEDGQEIGNRFLRLPELSAGSLSKQDPRSDICFAAGILFYLLTGDHPDVLHDGDGKLPHQRSAGLAKLHHSATTRLKKLLSLLDGAFAYRVKDRFSSADAMRERVNRMMQDQPEGGDPEDNLAAVREMLNSSANRQRADTVAKISEGLDKVHQIFNQVRRSIGGSLSLSHASREVTAHGGHATLQYSYPGSTEHLLSVKNEYSLRGEELVLRMSSDTVYRTGLADPSYGAEFENSVKSWLSARLFAIIANPNALPPEAEIFREHQPFGSLEAAAEHARQSERRILAFVYDPTKPKRGQLERVLGYFLENQRTHDLMNRAFVTALVPLAEVSAITNLLGDQSMETARWVLFDQQLKPLSQEVIYANPQEGERIMESLVNPVILGASTQQTTD